MKRRPSPLEEALQGRLRLLATTLRPSTLRGYQRTVRLFLEYLSGRFPEVRQPAELRRDPHVLGWLEHLWSRQSAHSGQRLANCTRAACLIQLRKLLDLLADHKHPPRPGLLLSEDIPRPDHVLPRPLPPQQDAALQAQLRRCNDLLSSALLLTRLTGIRIGECADLTPDCLRHLGGNHWSIHVPVGKLHSERWVPVDEQVRAVVARLSFLRTLPPAAEQFLLPRPKSRSVLCQDLRAALRAAADHAGIASKIVPHQLRHTYATSLLRAGVSLPALMKLLGHRTANMTLRYVEITQQDLQREFLQARQQPRHLVPMPLALDSGEPETPDAELVLQRLTSAVRVLDLFRMQTRRVAAPQLRLLARRLVRVRSRFKKLIQTGEEKK